MVRQDVFDSGKIVGKTLICLWYYRKVIDIDKMTLKALLVLHMTMECRKK